MMRVPSDKKKLLQFANDLVEKCMASAQSRAAYYRMLNQVTESGRTDGTKSLINMTYNHLSRTAAHLFSPTELRFTIDYENHYPANQLERAKVAARLLTRDFERSNTDMMFGQGVFEALKYGGAILKQWVQQETNEKNPVYYKRLVMPWQFGVYREDENELSKQVAMCERSVLTLPEVWQRIWMLPNADDLYNRIKGQAQRGLRPDDNNSFFHQILSTATLNTGVTANTRPPPGGIVQLGNDASNGFVSPQYDVDMVEFYELWVQDEHDYTTIQVIGDQILVSPLYKKANLLVPGEAESRLHPYTLIQPNFVPGYFYGRSELVDLIEPQNLLSMWADDIKRMFGLQIDKILGFSGDGIQDEQYDQMRAAGYFNLGAGGSVTDLTPKFPPEAIPMLKLIMEIMNQIGGFPNIMQGQGEPGVRAGSHANTLMKTGSPRLRDRSLLVERQCATAADLRLSLMEIKDGRNYWTDGSDLKKMQETSFLLHDLPEDRRVSVDSHSSSPIFADDHQQLIAFGVKAGFIDGESTIDMLPFPNKELLKSRYKEKQARAAAQMEQLKTSNPELYEKVMLKQGGKR